MRSTMFVIALCMTLMFTASPLQALVGDNVEVHIISDRGHEFTMIPYKDFSKSGTHFQKKYLEAKKGENYSIEVRNNTPDRIGVVVAVDGRNIISGKQSSLKHNEAMYIVEPYGRSTFDGWRTDRNTVNRFFFTDIEDSYAVQTFDDYSAMGVIAVAIFHEKVREVRRERDYMRKDMPQAAPGAPGAASPQFESKSDSAGTGFGDKEHSPTVKVEFESERTPFKNVLVKYEWREVLCKKGIIDCRIRHRNRLWGEDEYAPYPPGYRR